MPAGALYFRENGASWINVMKLSRALGRPASLSVKNKILPSRMTRAKWTHTKHKTIRKAKVLQHISILEVAGSCFEASFPRSFISLGFFSISERCKVAPATSESAAIFSKDNVVTRSFSSMVRRDAWAGARPHSSFFFSSSSFSSQIFSGKKPLNYQPMAYFLSIKYNQASNAIFLLR